MAIDFDYAIIMYNVFSIGDGDMVEKFQKHFNVDAEAAKKAIEVAKSAIEENRPRRNFVTSFMHYMGDNYRKLDSKQAWKVYCAADGYGWRRSADLKKINGGWDFSHIRDSSIEGWKRMEKCLNKMGFYANV